MAAALEAGVSRLFRIGGAHAVAAIAYGTDTVPRVDKIVGPGNRWVAAAKALVASDCGIDFYAGPTEIVIVAAKRAGRLDCRRSHRAGRARSRCPRGADHAEPDAGRARGRRGGERRCPLTARAGSHSASTAASSSPGQLPEAIDLANPRAAEHLVVDDDRDGGAGPVRRVAVRRQWSAQVAGDYAIGIQSRAADGRCGARARRPVGAPISCEQITVQRVTPAGLRGSATPW